MEPLARGLRFLILTVQVVGLIVGLAFWAIGIDPLGTAGAGDQAQTTAAPRFVGLRRSGCLAALRLPQAEGPRPQKQLTTLATVRQLTIGEG